MCTILCTIVSYSRRASKAIGSMGCKKCKSHAWPENALPKIPSNGPDRKNGGVKGQRRRGRGRGRGSGPITPPKQSTPPPVSKSPPLCYCLSIFSGLVFQPVTANATDDVCEFVYCNCLHCKRGALRVDGIHEQMNSAIRTHTKHICMYEYPLK